MLKEKRKIFLFRVFILLIICNLLSAEFVVAQGRRKETPPPLRERLFYGGSFGLQFGTITDIQASPIVGLWVLPRVAIAAGPNYRFFKDPFDKTDIIGGKVYTELVLIRDIGSFLPLGMNMGIFLHAEDELLSLESEFWKGSVSGPDRFFVNTILAGGGISQALGQRSSLNFTLLWALNEPVYEIYSNPEIRISFTF